MTLPTKIPTQSHMLTALHGPLTQDTQDAINMVPDQSYTLYDPMTTHYMVPDPVTHTHSVASYPTPRSYWAVGVKFAVVFLGPKPPTRCLSSHFLVVSFYIIQVQLSFSTTNSYVIRVPCPTSQFLISSHYQWVQQLPIWKDCSEHIQLTNSLVINSRHYAKFIF